VLLRIEPRGKLLVVRAFAPDGTLLPDEHLLPRLWFDFYLPKTLVRVRHRQCRIPSSSATRSRATARFVSLSRVRRASDVCVFVGGERARHTMSRSS
jgi:hypothetical protein